MPAQAETILPSAPQASRNDWRAEDVAALFDLPFNDLLHRAQSVHRLNFDPNSVQLSTLLNIKTGGCPEDCAYCPQSVHYQTGLKAERLLEVDEVLAAAKNARASGATRFCMGAAWRSPRGRDFEKVLELVSAVSGLGLETCATLGMLDGEQALKLKGAGLDFYNHNLDTSAAYYEKIIRTRTYADRLETLAHVRAAGINVCCGGIIGMGESRQDRIEMLLTLANLPEHPRSVPINLLVRVAGTPLENAPPLDPIEFVRTVAAARILMPRSWVRLSAGRNDMEEGVQALCFHAGANSIFYGDKLLTTDNPEAGKDLALLRRLGMSAQA